MHRKYLHILFFLFIGTFCLSGQDQKVVRQKERPVISKAEREGSNALKEKDSLSRDTIPAGVDSIPPIQAPPRSMENVKFSPDAPEAEIVYGAKERKWFDLDSNLVHLYGDAFVNYGTLELKAGYIKFDFKNNIASAEGIIDSTGEQAQKPTFKDGDNQFQYKKLRYNFKTQKGFVYNTYTTEGDLFVQGTKTKFVSRDNDSTQMYDQIFNQNAIITSCEHDHPHFGIRAKKLKVVPEQLAVLGPAQLEIADIPTPLFIPFAFFPLVQGKSSGLIFPDNYEYSPQWGFGLQNIGYYFALNDYWDVKLTGDIYLRGSWGIGADVNYTKRYKYRGGFKFSYANRINEVIGELDPQVNRSFRLNFTHNQDAKAHPYRKIGGSIDLEFGGFTQLNNPSYASRANSTRRSNLNWSHSMPGTPFSASASFNHSQNTNTRQVTVTAPNFQFRMQQIYPFKRKVIKGKQKWYENITLNYQSDFKNYVRSTDTTFFSQETLNNMEYGLRHTASTGTSVKVLKYFNFNPSINYEEIDYFRRNQSNLLNQLVLDSTLVDTNAFGESIYRVDTTFGVRQDTLITAWNPYRDFNASASLTTTIFGTKKWSKGKVRGIRHVIKPSVSMNYQPVNRGRYIDSVDTDLRASFNVPEEYEILPSGVFGQPQLNDLGAFNLSYRFKNDVEAKYLSKRDSTVKNIKVLNNWSISGNYNITADSFNFSRISFSTGTANFLQGIITLGFNMTLDPYALREDGSRSSAFYYSTNNRPVRFDNMSLTLNTNFTVKQIRDLIAGIGQDERKEETDEEKEKKKMKKPETFLDLFNDFSLSHTLRYNGMGEYERDTFFIGTNTLSLRGRVKLTDNWNIRIGNFGYDFKNQGFTYPDFGFERNLHCWNMNFSWQPRFGTYTFFIGVSSSTLNFIKTNYNKNVGDAQFGR